MLGSTLQNTGKGLPTFEISMKSIAHVAKDVSVLFVKSMQRKVTSVRLAAKIRIQILLWK